MAALRIITLNRPPRHVTLTDQPVTIGRDPDCEIYLDDAGASRRHALVAPNVAGRYVIEDLFSKNGTRVNDKPVRTRELEDGDEVLIGTSQLLFYADDVPTQTSVILVPDETTTDSTIYSATRGRPQLSAMRLNLLYDLSDRLTRLRNRGDLLRDVMDICVETFGLDRGVIALVEGNPDEPVWAHEYNRTEGRDLVISRSLLRRVLHDGQRVILNDPSTGSADPTVSVVQAGIRSAMCAPIRFQDRILGAIYGDRTTSTREYTQEEVDFLAAIATQLSVGLTNTWLMEEEARKVRMEGELRLAREIQRDLFPGTLPQGERIDVAVLNEPGLEVSGDYYDVITVSPERVAVVVGDVTGKGVAAAMLMANLQSAVRLAEIDQDSLAQCVAKWNALIHQNVKSSKFITMAVMVVDALSRKVTYCNAGHLPPAVVGPTGPRYLPGPSGLPLGVELDERYEEGRIELLPGEHWLLLYTDGVTEAMNPAAELFGENRLTEILRDRTWTNAADLIDAVAGGVRAFRGPAPRSDDLTMVAVHLPE